MISDAEITIPYGKTHNSIDIYYIFLYIYYIKIIKSS